MDALTKFLEVVIATKTSRIINTAVRKDAKTVTDLNTKAQLFKEGVDSKGTDLRSIGGDYTNFTKQLKLEKGQPIDRVTLKDTGDFYKTFFVMARNEDDFFTIDANTIKDQDDLTKRWGKDILGLTPESGEELGSKLKPEIINTFRRETGIL